MKVNVVLEEKKIPDFEAKYGLDVYNDKGQRYTIEFDRMGNLVVSSPKGALLVKPECSNKISIRIE
ncbi:hypothetical protein BF344P1_00052 [Bacteroides phage BF344P1]|jgi:hypothetical protein|nr:hypothetical protein BF344P1_00052 [Bacteroides phage BF344P1]